MGQTYMDMINRGHINGEGHVTYHMITHRFRESTKNNLLHVILYFSSNIYIYIYVYIYIYICYLLVLNYTESDLVKYQTQYF